MGRTVATFRDLIEQELQSWKQRFGRALRQEEQEHLEAMFNRVRLYIQACTYHFPVDAMHGIHVAGLIDRSFRPCFYVHGPESRLAPLAAALPARAPVSCTLTERQNIWDRQPLRVLQVCAHHPTLFAPLARFVRRFDSGLILYDSDLMLAPMYCWEKN